MVAITYSRPLAAIALAGALGSAGPAAAAPLGPPPAAQEQSYRTLATRTGLKLERMWTRYYWTWDGQETFAEFAERRTRQRRNGGIGLLSTGVAAMVVGAVFLNMAFGSCDDCDGFGGILGPTALGLGTVGATAGGVLLSVFQRRLRTLQAVSHAHVPRLRTRVAGPPRGPGLGLAIDF